MPLDPLAGQPVPPERLPNVPRIVAAYYTLQPDPADPAQRVAFGTSGHRGRSLEGAFTDAHVAAITQAVCTYRAAGGTTGPLFVGMDTHALSEAAFGTALEVLAANDVETVIEAGRGYTPTPTISHAILMYNRGRTTGLADGIVITPSHNPPEDGGFKYNPPTGGPAPSEATRAIEDEANRLLEAGGRGIRRMPLARALAAPTTHERDLAGPYIDDLEAVLDLETVRSAGLRLGVDPMGGANGAYWDRLAERYGLALEVVNRRVDAAFGFMRLDGDGRIRMDCSSPYAMAGLVDLRDRFDVAFGCDPDGDRHGIVTPGAGLMNPNHYLAVAVDYLFRHRPAWPAGAAVGKTLVSSAMIDRVAADLGRPLAEVPVGFKYFVEGLRSGALGFGGEESAGASFLRRDGSVWTTDKDGLLLALLAAEITAVTGRDPAEHYAALEARHGRAHYARTDAPASREQKAALARLSPNAVAADTLAGEPITARQTEAGGAPIGGLKVSAASGWFAARPSGTEDVYKIYAESFRSLDHLREIQEEARAIVAAALGG
ncbi:MAG: phosphoglucomutase (alpha-D-glucose-1,6-bisphosphate-dependent) [Rubricoccaceae bacterium]